MTSKHRSDLRKAMLNSARRLREKQGAHEVTVTNMYGMPNLWLRAPDGQEYKIKGIVLEPKEGVALHDLLRLTLEKHYPDCVIFFKEEKDDG